MEIPLHDPAQVTSFGRAKRRQKKIRDITRKILQWILLFGPILIVLGTSALIWQKWLNQ